VVKKNGYQLEWFDGLVRKSDSMDTKEADKHNEQYIRSIVQDEIKKSMKYIIEEVNKYIIQNING
jgi:hypothetical protein